MTRMVTKMKITRYLFLFCGLALVAHAAMTVLSEREDRPRWYYSPEGLAAAKAMKNAFTGRYDRGGDPADSALVFYFGDRDKPDTTDGWDSNIFFDHEGQGRAVRTGWVGSESGFLVFDRNKDGVINNGRELFGNHTSNGNPYEETGIAALSREDTNKDGHIDVQDANWPDLKIWRDKNHNGRIDPGELITLAQAGVTAIELAAKPQNLVLPNFNYVTAELPLTVKDGRRVRLYEIYFQRKLGDRKFLEEVQISPEDQGTVPQVNGSGLLRDLPEAAAGDADLRQKVVDFQRAATRQERLAAIDELLLAWAATGEAPATLAERAGGRYQLSADCLGGPDSERNRLLYLLYSFNGRRVLKLPNEMYPGQEAHSSFTVSGNRVDVICPGDQWAMMRDDYNKLVDRVYDQLAPSGALGRFYQDRAKGGWTRVIARLDEEFARNPEAALTDLMDLRLALAWSQTGRDDFAALDDYIRTRLETATITKDMSDSYRRLNEALEKTEQNRTSRPTFHWGLPNE